MYVDYDNEMLVLGAIRLAERIINALDSRQLEHIDIEQEVERLRQLAALGAEIRQLATPSDATTHQGEVSRSAISA